MAPVCAWLGCAAGSPGPIGGSAASSSPAIHPAIRISLPFSARRRDPALLDHEVLQRQAERGADMPGLVDVVGAAALDGGMRPAAQRGRGSDTPRRGADAE